MTGWENTYQGQNIVIGDDESLTINGKLIEYVNDSAAGTFYCQHLPYSTFNSLEDLSQAVVDEFAASKVLEFNSK